MIEVCSAYDDTIKVAASKLLENHLTKENAFDIISFCNLHSLVEALKMCQIFIAQNFEMDYLLKQGLQEKGIDKQLALEILQIKNESKKRKCQWCHRLTINQL